MLVKELIIKLEKYPQDAVIIRCTGEKYDVYKEISGLDGNSIFFADATIYFEKEKPSCKKAVILY